MNKQANGADESKGKSDLSSEEVADLIKFVKSTKDIDDGKFHEYAKGKGFNVHAAEAAMYKHIQGMSADSAKGDIVPGGKADKKTPADYPKDQIAMGQKVEAEHTDNPELARQIASDHLEEFPDYYTRLKKMEEQAKKELGETKQGRFLAAYFAKAAELCQSDAQADAMVEAIIRACK